MDQQTIQKKIMDLIASCPETAHTETIKEIIITALRLTENHVTEKDVAIIHTALKEMRYGMKFFSPYKTSRKISIFGSARTEPTEATYAYATEFAKRITEAGFMVITGAGEGIMRAAQEGAGRENSFGINILLPFEQSANQFIEDDPKLMTFKYFFTRKLFFIKEANAIALFPGGFGTHDEGFEALTLLQTGKEDPMPIVFIDVPGGTYWQSWLRHIKTEFAKRITEAGFMVITGAGEGIMRAAQEGAGRENSFGINILLPFEQSANQFIEDDPKLMTFKYFFTRKLFFIKEANAIALFPGGFGTHDEGFEALTLLQTGKEDPMPIVFIDVPGGTYWQSWLRHIKTEFVESGLISPEDLNLFKVTDQIDEAIAEITTFYRRYHSIFFVDEKPVLRIMGEVDIEMLKALNVHFSDIVVKGDIVETSLPCEPKDAVDLKHFWQITFHFDKRSFGRLRQMIDFINRYE